MLEQDFDILEKLKDKYDPNEIIKIQEEMSKESANVPQPTTSARNTPNPPQIATFAGDSNSDKKETKPEMDEAMPLQNVETLSADETTGETSNEAPAQGVESSDTKPAIPVESGMPATIAGAAESTAEATDDVDMK